MRKLVCLLLVLVLLPGCFAAAQGGGGVLFLSVSEITFSVVGESENIYVGTADPAEVVWESADPSIITVDSGVLTAAGVGTTTITARFGDQTVQCTAGCLAQDAEALTRVDNLLRLHAKRIPPKVEMDPVPFFSDAVIIGDSITYNMMTHELRTNLLGHPLFFARKNIGVNNFYNHVLNIFYQGRELSIEDAVAACGMKKAFFLLGMNDFAYQAPEVIAEKYAVVIDRVQEKSPDVQIYILTCLPAYAWIDSLEKHNSDVDRFNDLMVPIAEEKGCIIIDLARYMKNHKNAMAAEYTLDYVTHVNYEGCAAWMDLLRAYAWLEEMK